MIETQTDAGLINGKEISTAEIDQLKALIESTGYPEAIIKGIYTDAVLQHLGGMKYEDNVVYTDEVFSNLAQSQAVVNLAIQHSKSYK